MKIGLALSGGAARGVAHIGVLKYLEERKIKLSLLAGTSAGSIVAGFYCAGISLVEIENIALRLQWKDIARVILPRMGLIDSSLLGKFVELHIGKVSFEELHTPLQVNAVDLLCGEEVILESGPVARAIQASCAIPGIFTPVRVGDRLLVDGGLLNNVPVKPLKDRGVNFLIAVNLHTQRTLAGEPRNIFEVLAQSFYIIQRSHDLRSHRYADVVIEPDLADCGVWDIGRAEEYIRRGYEACRDSLEGINLSRPRNRFLKWIGLR